GPQRIHQGVAIAADVLQLIDQVDEEEQRQEGQGDEEHRRQDLPVKQAADGFHEAAPCCAGRAPSLASAALRQAPSRHHSVSKAAMVITPWMPNRPAPSLSLPEVTQAWLSVSTL